MNNQLEITSDFEQFKIGFVNRLINNYEDTPERQLAIDKMSDVIIYQFYGMLFRRKMKQIIAIIHKQFMYVSLMREADITKN